MKNPLAAVPTSFRWAFLGFAVSRVALYAFSAPVSDVEVYYRYALRAVDHGQVPYREITELEYPPTAYWTMLWPRYVMPERFEGQKVPFDRWLDNLLDYDLLFRGLMLIFDVLAFCCFVGIVRRRRPDRLTWCIWGYMLSTSAVGYVLLERLDPGLSLSFLAWAYAGLRADDPREPRRVFWSAVSYAALGFGISFKLIPVLLAPFALLVDFARLVRREAPPGWWCGPLVFAATALGPFLYYYMIVGSDLGRLFAFHAERGLEIEATYATLMMLTTPAAELHPYYTFGCWNLGGAWEMPLARKSMLLLVSTLAVIGLRCVWQAFRGRGYDRAAAYQAATVVIPLAVGLSKVFSIQYLVWVFPLLILAAAEFCGPRVFRAIVVLAIVMGLLSTFIFPFHFVELMNVSPYSDEHPPAWTLIEKMPGDGDEKPSPRVQPPTKREKPEFALPPNESRPAKPHLGMLNDHGPPWWAINVRNVLYVACVLTVIVGWWRGTRQSIQSAA